MVDHSTANDQPQASASNAETTPPSGSAAPPVEQLENLYQQLEAKYQMLLNGIGQGFHISELLYDSLGQVTDWRFLEVNPVFERQTGLQHAAGQLGSIVAPNVEPYWLEVYDQVVKTGEPTTLENYNAFTKRWYSAYVYRIGEAGDHQFAVLFDDITELKRAEQRQQFLLAFSDTIRPMADPALVATRACQLLAEHLNAGWAQYIRVAGEPGAEVDTVLGDYSRPGQFAGYHFSLRTFDEATMTLLRGGNSFVLTDADHDTRITAAQRTTLLADGSLSMVAIPLVKEGNLVALFIVQDAPPRNWLPKEVSLIEEIAERIWAAVEQAKAGQALRQSEELLRAVLESLADGIYIGGLEGITLINQPALDQLGYTSAQELNRNIATLAEEIQTRDWLTGEAIPLERQAFARALGGERVIQDVLVRNRQNGQDRVMRCAAAPVRVDGQVVAAVAIISDVTEFRQAEAALRLSEERYRRLSAELEERVKDRTQDLSQANTDLKRSNANLQQFAYVASHDLQEPLRKIQSFGSLLAQQLGDHLDESTTSYLQRITDASARMSTLIKDLLAYSRIETRQQVFGPVSLAAIMAGVLTTLDWEISQSGARVSVDPLPVVKGDNSQLSQLFQNLLTNAIKFVAPGQLPQVHIQYHHRSRNDLPSDVQPGVEAPFYHQISVTDQGVGFDNKFRDQIFQVFQRLHGRKEYPGTGVGLAICQRVVENHGGAIAASGQQPARPGVNVRCVPSSLIAVPVRLFYPDPIPFQLMHRFRLLTCISDPE
ncbi:ATP-binding protein [Spirosoma sp. KUDC1026]|uniref:ATP-binding protein n=1 Tax=Spirosoma sp. KUDC1026 TaxID=2745947 RepID=UPI001E577338|nr:ATP-binding protein [Spirosoma sp. KUDC1026]